MEIFINTENKFDKDTTNIREELFFAASLMCTIPEHMTIFRNDVEGTHFRTQDKITEYVTGTHF